MSGCVYVVRALTTNYYKIGRTTKIENRMSGLRATCPFWSLDIVVTHYHKEYKRIEKILHRRYSKERLKNSEWFELTSDDLTFLTMKTGVLLDSIGIGDVTYFSPVDVHEFFSSPQDEDEIIEDTTSVIEKPIVEKPAELSPIRKRLSYLHNEQDMTWRDIAVMEEFNGVSFGTLARIYHGREPKVPTLRRKLGLPTVEMIPQVRNHAGRFSKRSG